MVIYGVALLSACFLAGNFLGDILGALLHVKANVGGVGFAMLFLILLSNKGIDAGWLDKKSQEGIAFWYIPIVVAMSSIQNVVAAISGGAVAILGGLLCTVFGFLLIPIMSKNHAAKAE
ncbi:malonate transporter subunit MadL [Phascolarctobacterium succinatutens]|uniref:malonate transporter subunit MadL n=1 Tax=Phascolarctobacterium succinatutens TaxID=626940 RepID=UPI00307B0EF8